jgi:DNA-binding CsgD family transcriptional regulator
MRKLQRELACSRNLVEVSTALGCAARELVGVSGFFFVYPVKPVLTKDVSRVWSTELPPDEVNRLALERVSLLYKETASGVLPLATSPVFDIAKLYGRVALDRTETFNDFWKPCRVERQLVGIFGTAESMGGWVTLARTARERPFTDRDLDHACRLHGLAGRALATLARTFPEAPSDETLLAALSCGLPLSCAMFDTDGRLLWVSQEALLNLELDVADVGSTVIIRHENDRLARMRQAALAAMRRPEDAFSRVTVIPGNVQFSIRRIDASGRAPCILVVSEEPAVGPRRPPSEAITGPVHPRLTARESEVASLAALGYAVTNVAATLNITEWTVRTHLKQIYRKLGVRSRAELTFKLLMQSTTAPSPLSDPTPDESEQR